MSREESLESDGQAASLPSAVAPKEEMEEQHKEMALDMFKKITDYLNGELAGEVMASGP